MIVRKVTNNLFDVFQSEDSGWYGWSRIALDHKNKQSRVVGGEQMKQADLIKVVNEQIIPQLDAEMEFSQLMDRIKREHKQRLLQKLRYPYRDHYVTNKE